MKISPMAIISDIQGNLAAVNAIISECNGFGINVFCSLGNLVGFGPYSEECIEISNKFTISLAGTMDLVVSGILNKDYIGSNNRTRVFEFIMSNIRDESKQKLRSMTDSIYFNKIMFSSSLKHGDFSNSNRNKQRIIARPRYYQSKAFFFNPSSITATESISSAEEKVYLWCDIDEPAMFPGMVTDIHNLGIARYAIITDESVELRAIKYDAQPIIDFIDSVPGIDANYINLIKRGCHQPSDN
jgi:hypothetical protein